MQKNDQETVNTRLNKQIIKLAKKENYLVFRLDPPCSQLFLDNTETEAVP